MKVDKVWQALECVKVLGAVHYDLGICRGVITYLSDTGIPVWKGNFVECFKDWPESTGWSDYPVPSMCHRSPGDMFDFTSDDNMWNPKHPYGAARLRLLDHCINWFKEKNL